MLSLTGAPSCPTSRKAATIWGVIFSCYWSKGAFSLMPVFGLASASLWIDIPCSPGYSLPHWPLLLQFMASTFMVHSFGLDFVPRRNWPLPPANSSFSQFLLASNPWFTLQLPSSKYPGLMAFSQPLLWSHLTLTVSHVSVQIHAFHTLVRVFTLTPKLLPESQLGEQERAIWHW